MKKVGPTITPQTEAYCLSHFLRLNTGAGYIINAAPSVARKFIGIDIKDRFSAGELKLMIDVMNGTMLTPGMAGQHLQANVEDGIALDGLAEKWEVDGPGIVKKLADMSTPDLMFLEIWIQGFWKQLGSDRG